MILMMLAAVAATPHYPRPPTAAEKTVIIGKADDLLFDGRSARWRWPDKLNAKDAYCGFVNAKNRFGAYTGWKPFYYGLNAFGILTGGEESDDRVMYELICGVGGYIPMPEWLLKVSPPSAASGQ